MAYHSLKNTKKLLWKNRKEQKDFISENTGQKA